MLLWNNDMMRIHLCYYFVQVLREIDPSDRLLDSVTDPVRAYLRGRNDTVRCIITRYATRVGVVYIRSLILLTLVVVVVAAVVV